MNKGRMSTASDRRPTVSRGFGKAVFQERIGVVGKARETEASLTPPRPSLTIGAPPTLRRRSGGASSKNFLMPRRAIMSLNKPTALGERLKHELREYTVLVVYLYVCFVALVLFKAAILVGVGMSYLPLGLAAVKALILGKFVLLGQAARLGDGHVRNSVALAIVYKALLFVGLLFVLSMAEDAVIALIHGEAVGASLAAHLGSKLPETLAKCLVMLLFLIPYIAFQEIDKALGEDTLGKLLFRRRTGPEPTLDPLAADPQTRSI